MMKQFYRAIGAGCAIGLASYAYTVIENHYVGAFLFAFGLYIVITEKYWLYTGMIGDSRSIADDLICLAGNALGVILVGCIGYTIPAVRSNALTIVENKLMLPWSTVFLKALLCGMVIYWIVDIYRNRLTNPLVIIIGIPIFILSGMEHCIADLCYIVMSGTTEMVFEFMLSAIVGNLVGAKLMSYLRYNIDQIN